ncbi:MAG: ribulose-phosphate 3-epimerase [Minisyncoccota bacterium]
MTEVIPAIIVKNFKQLEEKVSLVKDYVSFVQVDITDGKFTHNITWPYTGDEGELEKLVGEDSGLPFWEDVDYEFHLMIENPEVTIEQWIKMGASRIVVQIESVTDMQSIIDQCKAAEVKLGIALRPSTDIEVIGKYINDIDCIQCMGNEELGRHGSSLDISVLDKIRILREKYPDMRIAIDIGVHEDTVSMILDAGADVLVAGSAIFDAENIRDAIENLR